MTVNNERDTKFLGFAALVIEDLSADIVSIAIDEDVNVDNLEHMGYIIAQRAYDLVEHSIGTAEFMKAIDYREDIHRALDSIPDLTEWPSIPPPAQKQ